MPKNTRHWLCANLLLALVSSVLAGCSAACPVRLQEVPVTVSSPPTDFVGAAIVVTYELHLPGSQYRLDARGIPSVSSRLVFEVAPMGPSLPLASACSHISFVGPEATETYVLRN